MSSDQPGPSQTQEVVFDVDTEGKECNVVRLSTKDNRLVRKKITLFTYTLDGIKKSFKSQAEGVFRIQKDIVTGRPLKTGDVIGSIDESMNYRNDPRLKKLLAKATLESLLKTYFERIYSQEEVNEMEDVLKNALKKYKRKDGLYEKLLRNDDKSVTPLVREYIGRLCEKPITSGKTHTPDNILTLALLFMRIGDNRLACELIWCSTSLAILEFITSRGLNVKVYSRDSKAQFVQALSSSLRNAFAVFEMCHTSFYTGGMYAAYCVKYEFGQAKKFLLNLKAFNLSDEKKKELEKIDFNC